MKTEKMTPLPPNCNPFAHDLYHMGTNISDKVTVMYDDKVSYLIIINRATGERIKVKL